MNSAKGLNEHKPLTFIETRHSIFGQDRYSDCFIYLFMHSLIFIMIDGDDNVFMLNVLLFCFRDLSKNALSYINGSVFRDLISLKIL